MDMFGAPIAGQSLAREPGNAAWEQPPQYTKVEDVLKYYLERFEEEDLFQDTLYLFDKGFPIDLFVDSMLLMGEQKGIHLFDVGFLVGPLLHEYIVGLCLAADINYVEFQDEQDGARVDKAIQDFMDAFGGDTGTLGGVADNIEEAEEMGTEGFSEGQEGAPVGEGAEAPPAAPEAAPEPPKGGLMRRPTNV